MEMKTKTPIKTPTTPNGIYLSLHIPLKYKKIEDAIRPIAPEIYKGTMVFDFALALYGLLVISLSQLEECKRSQRNDVEKSEFLYSIIYKKNSITECVIALEDSENSHILEKIRHHLDPDYIANSNPDHSSPVLISDNDDFVDQAENPIGNEPSTCSKDIGSAVNHMPGTGIKISYSESEQNRPATVLEERDLEPDNSTTLKRSHEANTTETEANICIQVEEKFSLVKETNPSITLNQDSIATQLLTCVDKKLRLALTGFAITLAGVITVATVVATLSKPSEHPQPKIDFYTEFTPHYVPPKLDTVNTTMKVMVDTLSSQMEFTVGEKDEIIDEGEFQPRIHNEKTGHLDKRTGFSTPFEEQSNYNYRSLHQSPSTDEPWMSTSTYDSAKPPELVTPEGQEESVPQAIKFSTTDATDQAVTGIGIDHSLRHLDDTSMRIFPLTISSPRTSLDTKLSSPSTRINLTIHTSMKYDWRTWHIQNGSQVVALTINGCFNQSDVHYFLSKMGKIQNFSLINGLCMCDEFEKDTTQMAGPEFENAIYTNIEEIYLSTFSECDLLYKYFVDYVSIPNLKKLTFDQPFISSSNLGYFDSFLWRHRHNLVEIQFIHAVLCQECELLLNKKKLVFPKLKVLGMSFKGSTSNSFSNAKSVRSFSKASPGLNQFLSNMSCGALDNRVLLEYWKNLNRAKSQLCRSSAEGIA